MASLTLLSAGIFKMVQGKMHAPYLWLELKVLNNQMLAALVSSLVMFQYPLALMILQVMIVLRFSYCMVPQESAYDFSWKSYFINAAVCVVWLLLTIGGSILLLFGTMIDQASYNMPDLQVKLLEGA